MPELQMMEQPLKKIIPPYKMLEHAVMPPVTIDDRTVLQAKVKFEDGFYNRDDKTPLHRGKIFSSMMEAAVQTVNDPNLTKDKKATFVYLTKDDGTMTWTQRMNGALEKKRLQPLASDDIVVAIDSGKPRAQEYVVYQKKTVSDSKIY
jgi:hypothetical protein